MVSDLQMECSPEGEDGHERLPLASSLLDAARDRPGTACAAEGAAASSGTTGAGGARGLDSFMGECDNRSNASPACAAIV